MIKFNLESFNLIACNKLQPESANDAAINKTKDILSAAADKKKKVCKLFWGEITFSCNCKGLKYNFSDWKGDAPEVVHYLIKFWRPLDSALLIL